MMVLPGRPIRTTASVSVTSSRFATGTLPPLVLNKRHHAVAARPRPGGPLEVSTRP